MFDKVPVQGQAYKPGDWKLYAVHDAHNIKGFFGEFRWLSNFEVSPCEYQGLTYPSVENAYQAAKLQPADRLVIAKWSPADSKRNWRTLTKLPETEAEWDARKNQVMAQILFSKFLLNPLLKDKLLATGTRYLEETNHWQDTWWGVDIRLGGLNHLGQLLSRLRNYWMVA